jgi:Mobilization protein NikA
MHASNRSKTLTGNVAARVTPEEQTRLQQRADEAGLTLSEWARQVLLEAVRSSQETRLLLSELLALRMIVLRLQLDLIDGEQPTKERLKEILERADATKHALAEQRIQGFKSPPTSAKSAGAAEASVS